MPLLESMLKSALGKQILVVQTDGKAFRGILTDCDEKIIHLTNVLETSSSIWKEPFLETSEEKVTLKEVIIVLSSVLRIYFLEPVKKIPVMEKRFGEHEKYVIKQISPP